LTDELTQLEEKVRNKALYAQLRELASSCMNALDQPFLSEYGTWKDRIENLIFGNTDMVAEILLLRQDLEEKKLCKCLLEADKSSKLIAGNTDISKKPPHASTIEDLKVELSFFLSRLLEEKDRLMRERFFSKEGMLRILSENIITEYLKYEKYLYDDNVTDFIIFPIENFIGQQSIIEFGDHIQIKIVGQEEFHNLADVQEKYEGGLISYPEFCIYIPAQNDWMRDSIKIITAFRILKKGEMGLKNAYYGYAFPFKPWKILEPPAETKFYREKSRSLYESKNSETEEVIRFFTILESVRDINYLSVALHRYNLAYQRDTDEDKFIDYFVSLESLFSTTSERGEVTHKISTRASRILAESFEDRKKMQSRIKKLYGYRSGIVHGEPVHLRQGDVDSLEEIVRTSLKWFINKKNSTNHNEIINEIDLQPENEK